MIELLKPNRREAGGSGRHHHREGAMNFTDSALFFGAAAKNCGHTSSAQHQVRSRPSSAWNLSQG